MAEETKPTPDQTGGDQQLGGVDEQSLDQDLNDQT